MSGDNMDDKDILKKYYFWLFSGLGCLGLLFKLIYSTQWFCIVMDIVSILCGGIFASVVVAIFIEIINQRKNAEKKIMQREIILSRLKFFLLGLIKNEVRIMNQTQTIIENDTLYKRVNKEMTINESIDYLIKMYEKFFSLNFLNYEQKIKNTKSFESAFFDASVGFYQRLKEEGESITLNMTEYKLSGIFNEEEETLFNQTFCYMEEIISRSKSKQIDYLLDMKECFFEDLKRFLNHFKITNCDKKIFRQPLFEEDTHIFEEIVKYLYNKRSKDNALLK